MAVGQFVSQAARAEYDTIYDRGFAALPEPSARRDIPTAFGTVRVYRFGDGQATPMVLLPGRAGTAVMWEPNLAAFATRGPVYAVDLIGEPGRSEQTAPIKNAADQAAWLVTVLEQLGHPGVHVAGYSFGGWLAANLAIRAPGRVASLTLIDPVQTFARFPAQLLLRTALTLVPGIKERARASFLRWIGGTDTVAADDPVASVINEGMRSYRIALPTPTLFTAAQWASVTMPVLALIAGRSVIHDGPKAARRAEAALPGARVELWSSASHSIAGEYPDAVSDTVLGFIGEIEREEAAG
ncbi:alpha/beta fold hydrolase [Saccharomonospora sp. NPDC006951]